MAPQKWALVYSMGGLPSSIHSHNICSNKVSSKELLRASDALLPHPHVCIRGGDRRPQKPWVQRSQGHPMRWFCFHDILGRVALE